MVDNLPRKVLHVMNSSAGGAALSTIGLMRALDRLGVSSCATCHDAGSADERKALLDSTHGEVLFLPLYWWNYKIRAQIWKRPIIEARQLYQTGWRRRSTARVASFAREHGAELIHSNTIVTLEGGLASRRLGLPHVWHIRELIGPGGPCRLPREGVSLGRFLDRLAERVVANSHITGRILEPWLPPGLLDIVPNGIDIAGFEPRHEAPARVPLVVAMVGSPTSRWKNHMLFVQAAGKVDRSLPIEFRIYGHDPSRSGTVSGDEYLDTLNAEIRRLGLGDRFHLVGFRSNPAEIMAEIDILLHPTEQESFGRIVVEAMAAALPVVGVDGGGVGEIVRHGETGLLSPPHDATALARNIEWLAARPAEQRRFGIAGRARAAEQYTLEVHTQRMLEVYRSAMKRHSRLGK